MGTRLYPNTKNPTILEKLAGVPADTHKLWLIIETDRVEHKQHLERLWEQGQHSRNDLWRINEDFSEKLYYRIKENPDVDQLDSFIMYGWGKIQFNGGCSGEHTDSYNVDQVLFWQGVDLNGVTLEELEGVYWC